ncbi:hypothetical protein [Aestuariivirga sp.]|uniref:hypothetical protein n=1 Tax=Aestuariivirga sp. TaxID=2650926 RepID=UPI0035948A94
MTGVAQLRLAGIGDCGKFGFRQRASPIRQCADADTSPDDAVDFASKFGRQPQFSFGFWISLTGDVQPGTLRRTDTTLADGCRTPFAGQIG